MGHSDPREPAAVRAGGARRGIDVVPAAGVLRVACASAREGPNADGVGALLRGVVPGFCRVAGVEAVSAVNILGKYLNFLCGGTRSVASVRQMRPRRSVALHRPYFPSFRNNSGNFRKAMIWRFVCMAGCAGVPNTIEPGGK